MLYRELIVQRPYLEKSFSSPESREELRGTGVTAKEHKGAECWEARRCQCTDVHQPVAWVHNKCYPQRQNGGEKIK